MESEIIDVENRDELRLYLITDAVLTLVERGFLSRSVIEVDNNTIHLVIDLPFSVFYESLKESGLCVNVEEASGVVDAIKRGTGDNVPVTSSSRIKNFITKIFRKPFKKNDI